MAVPTPKTYGFDPAQVASIVDPALINAQRAQAARAAISTSPPAVVPDGTNAALAPGTTDDVGPDAPADGMNPVESPDLAALEGGDDWKKGMDIAQLSAGGVGGMLEALGMPGSGESAYNLPGAGGADKMDLAGVGAPFRSGKMKAADRQSLALALLK